MGVKFRRSSLREECELRVFVNRMQRTTFGFKRDEVGGEWSKPHSEEVCDQYSSPNIGGKPKTNRQLVRPGYCKRIILKCIFRKWGCRGKHLVLRGTR